MKKEGISETISLKFSIHLYIKLGGISLRDLTQFCGNGAVSSAVTQLKKKSMYVLNDTNVVYMYRKLK